MKEIQILTDRFPQLKEISAEIEKATKILAETITADGCIFTCGNGGSAADAEHIVGELMKSFVAKRPLDAASQKLLVDFGERGERLASVLQQGFRAIPLTGMVSLSTAYLNDCDPYCVFAQQVFTLSDEKDSLICISTSGNSKNVVYAAIAAKAKGAKVITLSGRDGGELKSISDVNIIVPEKKTHVIQELHLPIYHAICLQLERMFFPKC